MHQQFRSETIKTVEQMENDPALHGEALALLESDDVVLTDRNKMLMQAARVLAHEARVGRDIERQAAFFESCRPKRGRPKKCQTNSIEATTTLDASPQDA